MHSDERSWSRLRALYILIVRVPSSKAHVKPADTGIMVIHDQQFLMMRPELDVVCRAYMIGVTLQSTVSKNSKDPTKAANVP